MKKSLLFGICSVLSFQYISILSSLPAEYWLHYTQKPFVYRALIPLLGQNGTGTLVLAFLFAAGLALAMLYAYQKYWNKSTKNDVAFVLSFFAITVIFTRYSNYYDFASAFFFLVILLLWVEGKFLLSIPVFALACLNRETSVFIIPILFLIKRHKTLLLYIFVYVVTMFLVRWTYSDSGGSYIYINLLLNAIIHAKYYLATTVLVFSLSTILMLFVKNVPFVKKEFSVYVAVLLPVLCGVYFFSGYAFEIRVLGEVLPLFFMSAFLQNKKEKNETQTV